MPCVHSIESSILQEPRSYRTPPLHPFIASPANYVSEPKRRLLGTPELRPRWRSRRGRGREEKEEEEEEEEEGVTEAASFENNSRLPEAAGSKLGRRCGKVCAGSELEAPWRWRKNKVYVALGVDEASQLGGSSPTAEGWRLEEDEDEEEEEEEEQDDVGLGKQRAASRSEARLFSVAAIGPNDGVSSAKANAALACMTKFHIRRTGGLLSMAIKRNYAGQRRL
ncbi:hypothetical protein KM043_002130 [Ampulex compressa]|nr:hypothetical protein KM043_002130 [Ampulex compressa]